MATFKAVFVNMTILSGPTYVDLGREIDTLATAFPAAQALEKKEQERVKKNDPKGVLPVLTGLRYG